VSTAKRPPLNIDQPRRSEAQGDLFAPAAPPAEPAPPPVAIAPVVGPVVAQVCVPADLGLLSYGLPVDLAPRALPGCRVTVPLRGRLVVGVVWQLIAVTELDFSPEKLRPIATLIDESPLLTPSVMATIGFISRYYHCGLGMALRTCLPAPLRRTGFGSDKIPEKLTWWAAIETGREWPVDLPGRQKRVLERLLALGDTRVAALRKRFDPESGGFKTVSVPQRMLDELAAGGLIRLWQERVIRDPLGMRTAVEMDLPPLATGEQNEAVRAITKAMHEERFEAFVLRGVTGSGKTEVYMRAIAAALPADGKGGGAIVLVPEIALTPQLVGRFRARFGERVAVLHSALSDGERYDQLTKIATGQTPIVIGPRSALFAPLPKLAVIVLDECHDSSFKQQSGIRYHARDVALVLARHANAVCVMGSATPGLRELHLCVTGRATRLDMFHRVHGRPMPACELVDLRTSDRLRDPDTERPSLLSTRLVEAIAGVVQRGEQAIILHNRRGFATTAVCTGCGEAFECPECAVSLTVHRRQRRMRCHYCDRTEALEQSCQKCGGGNLLHVGSGTERLEATLSDAIAGVRVRRFDRDTATGRQLLNTLDEFRRGDLDVLVGTQMLAKGHDFPSVTLVGVALAETGLRVPDYLASERTFQLLTQVAGRAGRGEVPGRVIVQTYAPGHPAITLALGHAHAAFCAHELEQRRRTNYPPFVHLALVETRCRDPEPALRAAEHAVAILRQQNLEARGPVAAGISKVRGVYRFHALVRSVERQPLHAGLRAMSHYLKPKIPATVRLTVDIDPTDFA
jgi:primosomal protein N' (replication factor Y) (superfamily II helicase)